MKQIGSKSGTTNTIVSNRFGFLFEMTFGMYVGPFLIYIDDEKLSSKAIGRSLAVAGRTKNILLWNTCYPSVCETITSAKITFQFLPCLALCVALFLWTIGFLSFVVKYGQGQVIVTFSNVPNFIRWANKFNEKMAN